MLVTLTITGDGGGKREISLRKPGEYVVGRIDDAPIQIIDDLRVSKRHALLIVSPLEVRVRDLNSANGTRVDGVMLGTRPDESPAPRDNEGDEDDGLTPAEMPTVSLSGAPPTTARKELQVGDGSVFEVGSTRIEIGLGLDPNDEQKVSAWIGQAVNKINDAMALLARAREIDPRNARARRLCEGLEEALRSPGAPAAPPPAPGPRE